MPLAFDPDVPRSPKVPRILDASSPMPMSVRAWNAPVTTVGSLDIHVCVCSLSSVNDPANFQSAIGVVQAAQFASDLHSDGGDATSHLWMALYISQFTL